MVSLKSTNLIHLIHKYVEMGSRNHRKTKRGVTGLVGSGGVTINMWKVSTLPGFLGRRRSPKLGKVCVVVVQGFVRACGIWPKSPKCTFVEGLSGPQEGFLLGLLLY